MKLKDLRDLSRSHLTSKGRCVHKWQTLEHKEYPRVTDIEDRGPARGHTDHVCSECHTVLRSYWPARDQIGASLPLMPQIVTDRAELTGLLSKLSGNLVVRGA